MGHFEGFAVDSRGHQHTQPGSVTVTKTIPRPRLKKPGDLIPLIKRRDFALYAYSLAWENAVDGRIGNAAWNNLIRQKMNVSDQQSSRLRTLVGKLGWTKASRGKRYAEVSATPEVLVHPSPKEDAIIAKTVHRRTVDTPTPTIESVAIEKPFPTTTDDTANFDWLSIHTQDTVTGVADLIAAYNAAIKENANLREENSGLWAQIFSLEERHAKAVQALAPET